MAVFSAIWAGLLVVAFAIAFLHIRTPSIPLARAASIGILGLGIAGICGALCPDQHFLHWWSATGVGGTLARAGGLVLSAACFGFVTTLFVGLVSSFLVIGDPRILQGVSLPALALLVLLLPGVVLQSVGASFGVFAAWLAGAAAGAFLGVLGGTWTRRLASRS